MNKLLQGVLILAACALTGFPAVARAQEGLDGAHRPFHDELLENLVGKWKITGTVMGRTQKGTYDAEWVLNHQFLRIHHKDENGSPEAPWAYQAMVFIGYDNASDRYVAHWLDVFGGRFPETLGYGTRSGNSIKFVFEYPDGPFHNTFTWDPKTKTWKFLLQQKDKTGRWTVFAEQQLQKP